MEAVFAGSENSQSSAYELISSKIEIRDFAQRPVSADVRRKILEAARMTGSGMNAQHWRFVLVQDKSRLKQLADDSTTGLWVEKADFAVIVLTNSKYAFHMLDAGRVIQDMMIAAWSFGVASGIYTGVNAKAMTVDFALPSDMYLAAVVGFGYPKRRIHGIKNRKPVEKLAYLDRYGKPIVL